MSSKIGSPESIPYSFIRVGHDKHPYFFVKRLLDVVLTTAFLLISTPLLAFIALCIRLDSPGPVIFKQKRVGKDGQVFTCYKFRSMYYGSSDPRERAFMRAFIHGKMSELAGKGGNTFKGHQQGRVTHMGRILRRTSLDELPQLINVLQGNMSIVGPRPHVVREVDEYAPWHRRRLASLPGITGWAQVNGRSCLTFDRLVRYDIEYIERQSLAFDLEILFKTIAVVITGDGTE
jgi:lipopolysaccharide/colanic/teichoic acid biosynthesis glycosyltransferase